MLYDNKKKTFYTIFSLFHKRNIQQTIDFFIISHDFYSTLIIFKSNIINILYNNAYGLLEYHHKYSITSLVQVSFVFLFPNQMNMK